MYRLCFGTIMTILYQARSHKVTNKSICNALFSCFGKTVESYDSSTPGHLKSGKINVPPDVIDAARKTNADELDAAVQKNIIPLIKLSQQEAIVRSLKDIIRNDSSIMDNTVIGYCSGYEKQSILGGQVFCISSLLASVIYYAWMMDNIYIRNDPDGNIKADKEKSTEKIDGAIATIMGLDRAIRCGNDVSTSVYDERGILFI